MGWAIEEGIWYSPIVVYDLDGDGAPESRRLQRLLDSHPDAVFISDGGEFGQWAQAVPVHGGMNPAPMRASACWR